MARSGERAIDLNQDLPFRISGLSAGDSCFEQNQTSICSLETPQSRRRRLSLCSLPAPKQFVVSLRSLISFAQWANCRTWQSAHGIILMFLHS